ncbi:MAG: T9SS type A sorting domain-containing protein [Ignavibacteria bacterium]|nr:T9SS type A sorting domain-containing protein [Ignavibacteria bacterium]
MRPGVLSTVSGIILNENIPVSDAVVYAKQGDQYVGFGVSNALGEYTIENIPVGDYILVAHKIGSESNQRVVTITEKMNSSINFSLTAKTGSIANTNPFEFALSQNYPNPFNPNTVISYSIASEGNVTLKVFNSTGQQVSELVNANQSAGIYNVEFNASSLSSGVYFYRLDANGFTATNKMILVK